VLELNIDEKTLKEDLLEVPKKSNNGQNNILVVLNPTKYTVTSDDIDDEEDIIIDESSRLKPSKNYKHLSNKSEPLLNSYEII
jgi:hypothetical protein